MKPGTIVGVRVLGVVHEGIVSDRPGHVIHKSARVGSVAEEPISDFAQGRRWFVVGYPSNAPPSSVVERARSRIGEPWTAIRNCRDFVRSCHGRYVGPTLAVIGRVGERGMAEPRGASSPLIGSVIGGKRYTRAVADASYRVGQIEPAGGFLASVDALDVVWNETAEAICGTARGLDCSNPLRLSDSAIRSFRTQLGRWRLWRDDVRGRMVIWASANAEFEAYRAELDRWRATVRRHGGETHAGHESPNRPDTWSEDIAQAVSPSISFGLGAAAFVGVLALGAGIYVAAKG